MWGFESLLPCQILQGGGRRESAGQRGSQNGRSETMAEALKVKDDSIHGGGNGGNGESAIASSFGRLTSLPRRWKQFYHDVRSEMAKVVWPTRQDVISLTGVVIVTVAFFGLFFLLTDSVFSRLETVVLNYFKH
jgi:preprotein translocase subunit SecE